MIIRIIPVRILILSLQGKKKICRNTPCSCLASLVPLGGMMVLAVVLGTTNGWCDALQRLGDEQDVVGHTRSQRGVGDAWFIH